MHRGGGVCIEGPAADSLPKVSPRIRALQDRLLDSLPADGAWECLSPAQREAIISLHRARLTHTFVTGNAAPDRTKHPKRKRHANNNAKPTAKGINGYRRSRSYEDKLESETDDSGVRVAGGPLGERGTNSSSTSNSQNSHEDDSSDPGVKRSSGGGRFAKSLSADRLARSKDGGTRIPGSQPATDAARAPKRKGVVTNGVGNVNKIISKQLQSRSGSHQSTSNVTLDCRNVQGERRRTRIDTDASLFETRQQRQQQHKMRRYHEGAVAKPQEAVISRRNILQRYQDSSPSSPPSHGALKGGKDSPSSEGYDSGVNFRFDGGGMINEGALFDQSLQSRSSQELGGREKHDFGFYFESDRPPRTDSTTPSPCSPTRKEGVRWGRGLSHDRDSPKSHSRTALGVEDIAEGGAKYEERDTGKIKTTGPFLRNGGDHRTEGGLLPSAVLKKNKKATGKSKLESNFDYRTHLNQETLTNKYSSNWNSIILSKELPIKSYPMDHAHSETLYRTSVAPHGRSVGNLVLASSRTTKGGGDRVRPEDEMGEPQTFGSESGGAGKKFLRSKSLDRKYLEDSSDDESDFELRRRTERMIRYAKASGVEWDDRKQVSPSAGLEGSSSMGELFISNPLPDYPPYDGGIEARDMSRPKAKSAWDISLGGQNHPDISGEDAERILSNGNFCVRSRNTAMNRWKSEEADLASRVRYQGVSGNPGGPNFDTRKNAFNQDLSRSRWRRRSYDVELDASDAEDEVGAAGNPHEAMPSFPQFENQSMGKEWQRRSCDVELELGNLEDNFQEGKNPYGDDSWEQSVEGEMRLAQQRQRLVSYPPRGKQPRRRRGYPTQDSPTGEETKKKKVAERNYVEEELSVEDEDESSPLSMNDTMGHTLQYQIRPEITGRKWARLEDMQNCGPIFPGHKSSNPKGRNGKIPHGFRGKLKFFKSILSL